MQGSAVYVAGSFTGAAATFGPLTVANTASATTDAFVARLDDGSNLPAFTCPKSKA